MASRSSTCCLSACIMMTPSSIRAVKDDDASSSDQPATTPTRSGTQPSVHPREHDADADADADADRAQGHARDHATRAGSTWPPSVAKARPHTLPRHRGYVLRAPRTPRSLTSSHALAQLQSLHAFPSSVTGCNTATARQMPISAHAPKRVHAR
eukprot:535385-Pleurochrysis_carterae.AAC.1